MSDADTLRKAAAQMREKAHAATPGRWRMAEQHGRDIADEGWSEVVVFTDALPDKGSGYPGGVLAFTAIPHGPDDDTDAQGDAEHIASWHPQVALAAADFIDLAAGWVEEYPGSNPPWVIRALAVARAYLGGES